MELCCRSYVGCDVRIRVCCVLNDDEGIKVKRQFSTIRDVVFLVTLILYIFMFLSLKVRSFTIEAVIPWVHQLQKMVLMNH